MDSNYFKKNEDIDWKYLNFFNEKTKIFDTLTRNQEYDVIDARAKSKNRQFNIELKLRFVDMNKYDGIFIETNKISNLLLEYICYGYEPLYINFFQDEEHLAIWNLIKLTDFNYKPTIKIKDNGHEAYKYEPRNLIYLRDAVIYEYDSNSDKYKIIKPYE